jgi:dTDP-D-glucose 4,6-dehydratase
MKILMTGGAGFIGSNFIRHVLGAGRGIGIVNYD